MKKAFLFCIFLLAAFVSYGQSAAVKKATAIRRYADSIHTSRLYPLSECDSIPYRNDKLVYRCWRFYFSDSARTLLAKFTCSFGPFREWEYYYRDNRVVLVQRNARRKGTTVPKWRAYFEGDSLIHTWGSREPVVTDEVEGAQHFLRIGLERAKTGG